MAVIKFLLNNLSLGTYLATYYTTFFLYSAERFISNRDNQEKIWGVRNRMYLPYRDDLVPTNYNIFDQIGGIDIFNLLVNPQHMFAISCHTMKDQVICFTYTDSRGWLKILRIRVEFNPCNQTGVLLVVFQQANPLPLPISWVKTMYKKLDPQYHWADGERRERDTYYGASTRDGLINEKLVRQFEDFMRIALSF